MSKSTATEVSFISHNSRKFTPHIINNFSRGDAFECAIPPTAAKDWNSATLACYSESQQVLDPFIVKSIPSENQLHSWKMDINNNGRKYIQTYSGTLDINCINVLLKLHTAKNIQAAVQQEVNWFSKSYNKPQTVSQHPPPSSIADFQKMLYLNRYDAICNENGMTPMELAMGCVNRWLSSDHITWMMKTLTESQNDTYCIFLNGALNTDPKTYRRFRNGNANLPSKFIFALNVGRDERGTFLGADDKRGCHWTLCHVDIVAKKIVYGDSLAWPFPSGLLCRVEKYIKAVCKDDEISNYSIVMLHDPQNQCLMSGMHRCGATCAQLYPLQTCTNICGIVVMVVAAIACHNYEFFQHISTSHSNATTFPPIFLQTPSRFGKYLRFVVASWLASNSVNLEYVVPRIWKQQQDHLTSSCSMIYADGESHNNISTPSTDGSKDECKTSNQGIAARTLDHGTPVVVITSDSDGDVTSPPANYMKHDNPIVSPTKKSVPVKEKHYKCSHCDSMFTRKFTLKRHIRNKHINEQPNGNCSCRDCGFKCHKITDLRKHLARTHNVLFRSEKLILENMNEFKEWKGSVEEKEVCTFTKKTGNKGQEGNIQYFQCNRGGIYKPGGTGKRRTKSQGTCKIQHNCTSTIRAETTTNGNIEVNVCYTHYGHEPELQHTWLPKSKRQQVAALLQQGVSRDKILSDIRDSAMQEGNEFARYHLTARKDIANIMQSFGINDVQKHPDDQESVRAWVEEWSKSENNPVLFHKYQGEPAPDGYDLAKKDFMIIIQSPFQKDMAHKFASNGICIDATHGTTGYDFPLTSLVVVDEYGEGLPIAWCLSNHEDFTHMCVFFEMVKRNCGVLTPIAIMSDLASQFYNAWLGVMGGKPLRLLCTWHVDKAWQTELRVKVKDTVVAAEIYKMLRTVLQQTDITLFQDYLAQLLECLPSLSLEFCQYFQNEWLGREEWWAYCYRTGLGINTNMMVEAFHRVFKYNYLKGKYNKRVDNCLVNLLKFTRDKLFERLIKLTKGKSTSKLRNIQDRHNKSMALTIDSVECVDGSKWLIKSENNCNTYTVSKQQHTCTDATCQLKCTECNIPICIHQYICTCPDCLIQHTICKHIHLLQRFLSSDKKLTENDAEMEVTDSSQDFVTSELHLLSSHIHTQNKAPNDLASLKQEIRGKLLTLGEQIELCTNKEALQQLDKQINAAQNLFSSLQKHVGHHKMQPITNTPANKNIEKQKGFRSTKKKTRTANRTRFAKPSTEDICSLFPQTNNVKELLKSFGVSNKVIKTVMETNGLISDNDLHLDKDHPSAEALNYNMMSIKRYLSPDAWNKVNNLLQELQDEWKCCTCDKAKFEDMIMCDSCLNWHHWKCVKIENDEWYCQICENLNQDMSS